jgi:uncharacterized protein (TIGR03437 family)
VGLTHRHLSLFLLISISGSLQAAPLLRLVNSVVGPVSAAVGTAPAAQTLEAYNAGDGSLTLAATVDPSVTWLSAAVGTARACTTTTAASSCIPLNFTFKTTSLTAGIYTAAITISDANHAVDSPQVVMVTVQMGGAVPNSIGQTQPVYLAPGSAVSIPFSTNAMLNGHATTQSGGNWLSLALEGTGSFRFVLPYQINISALSGMAPGTYSGTLVTSGSTFAPDNKTIPVTMQVTTQPIAVPSVNQINLVLAQGAPAIAYPFIPALSLSNTGAGSITVSGVSATGTGVSATNYMGLGLVTVDPTGLAPGSYTGSVVVACNAVNCPVTVLVNFQVVAQAPPSINYQGAVNNATQIPGETVSPGDWMALLGTQLSLDPFTQASVVPLPTMLADVTVTVNGEAAPLDYTSYGQIAFQMPTDTPVGTALVQVQRAGQASNTVSVPVAARAPRIVVITDDCATGCNLRNAATPASPGDTIVLWAYGLGPTDPPVAAGAAPPADPPLVTPQPLVNIGGGPGSIDVTPVFAGMTEIGLYQINVTIPLVGSPMGVVPVSLVFPDSIVSNQIQILIQ